MIKNNDNSENNNEKTDNQFYKNSNNITNIITNNKLKLK